MEADDAARRRLEELFEAHYGELTRFATRRVGADAAADVVSNTFLAAYRRLPEVPAGHERGWLYATARHVIANELRSRARQGRLVDRLGVAADARVEDHADQVSDELRVRAVLARLSPADQEVLRLTEWEGLDPAEVAAVLGCSRTAVKVRLHRARRRFAARLLANEQGDTRPVRAMPLPSALTEGSTQS
jgi:RNA polymerase sigma-70 factor, ECF subfamily